MMKTVASSSSTIVERMLFKALHFDSSEFGKRRRAEVARLSAIGHGPQGASCVLDSDAPACREAWA